MNPLGLGEKGAVRAGVCIYIDDKDVDRLLEVVSLIWKKPENLRVVAYSKLIK